MIPYIGVGAQMKPRKVAEQLDDPIVQQTMLEIVSSYDKLAVLAEAKSAAED